MNRAVSSVYGHMSPLALDLVLSRVGVAALRAEAKASLTAEEVSATEGLKEFVSHVIETLEIPTTIPAAVVPEDSIREVLQQTLATMAPVRTSCKLDDPAALKRLVGLLTVLHDEKNLTSGQAAELSKELSKIKPHTMVEESEWNLDLVDGH